MAHDLLLGKIPRDWSCGKTAAELWDEAESQRVHHPVHWMAPLRHNKILEPPSPPDQSSTPWGWIFGIGAAVTGVVLLAVKPKLKITGKTK